MRRPNIATLIAAAALATAGSAHAGATSEHELDLAPYLASQSLAAKDVGFAVTLVHPAPGANWTRGLVGEVDPLLVDLRPKAKGSAANVDVSLKLRLEALAPAAWSCNAAGDCDELAIKRQGAALEIELLGQPWTIEAAPQACRSATSCTVTVPSWALAERLQNGGAVRPFPAVVAVVGHAKGLALFDATTRELWLTLPLPSTLKTFRDATLDASGLVVVAFAEGQFVVDVASDRAFVVDANGVRVAEKGLASQSEPKWKSIFSHGALGVPVAVEATRLVWTKASAKWTRGAGLARDVVEPAVVAETAAPEPHAVSVGAGAKDGETATGERIVKEGTGAACLWQVIEPTPDGKGKKSGLAAPCAGHGVMKATASELSFSVVAGSKLSIAILRK